MIHKYEDDSEPLKFLPITGQVEAMFAAKQLWREIFELDGAVGLAVTLIQPTESAPNRWGVQWKTGPNDWASIYASSPEARVNEFSVTAEDAITVFFEDHI